VRAYRVWVAAFLVAPVAGCAGPGPGGARSETCVSWVDFATPADAVADADLVITTEGTATATGTAEVFGAEAAVHAVEVADVLAGAGAAAGDRIEVVSTPVTCTGGAVYPDGDPLDAAGPLVILLERDEDIGAWRTLTPLQGVVAADDGSVPEAWPAG
jgi:hypothetical protein